MAEVLIVTGTEQEIIQALQTVLAQVEGGDARPAIQGTGGDVVFKVVDEGSDEDFGDIQVEVV